MISKPEFSGKQGEFRNRRMSLKFLARLGQL
jgi:hypothetical protein